jgi:hypothetical protein
LTNACQAKLPHHKQSYGVKAPTEQVLITSHNIQKADHDNAYTLGSRQQVPGLSKMLSMAPVLSAHTP